MSYEPDPFDDGDDQSTPRNQSAPFKQLRDHAKQLEKDLKAREKELEELRDFKAAAQLSAKRELLRQSFTQVGLKEKHAELFEAARPDVEPTPEAVKAFAVEYGFVTPAADPAEDDDENDGSFSPTPPAGDPAHKKVMSSEEFDELHKTDPAAAMRAAEEGRVQFQTKY